MYNVMFVDKVHGTTTEEFTAYDEAMEYWQDYADTETCVAGSMWDADTGEVIWEFDDTNSEG